jgi:hypothetical protein
VIALTMIVSPMWLALARRLHELGAAAPERLSHLWARLLSEEARVIRQGSETLVHNGAQLAVRLGGRVDRLIERSRASAPKPPA